MSDLNDPAGRQRIDRLRRTAALASVGVAVTLLAVKLAAVLVTGSTAILSSLLDSAADIAASGMTLLAVRAAAKPADRTHRYGHGKAESLSALAHTAFVGGSGLAIIIDSLSRVLEPRPIDLPEAGIGAMAISILLTGALVLYQRHVIRSTGSAAIEADNLNYQGDLLTGAAIIVTLWLVKWTGWLWLDQVMAVALAIYLFMTAARIAVSAVNRLMDREMPQAYRDRVKATVRAHPAVHDLHDLRTRSAGAAEFIELHLELDGHLQLNEVHDIMDALEASLAQAFPAAEVILHPEPAGLVDDRLDHRLG
jgi:ferrous-iron efflux pump FieF